jgi:hypothetical protein
MKNHEKYGTMRHNARHLEDILGDIANICQYDISSHSRINEGSQNDPKIWI